MIKYKPCQYFLFQLNKSKASGSILQNNVFSSTFYQNNEGGEGLFLVGSHLANLRSLT